MRTSQISVALDIYAIVISSVLLKYTWSQPKVKRHVNEYFVLLCVSNLMMLLGDMSIWLCEGFARSWFPPVIRGGTLLLYLGGLSAPLIYTCYVKNFIAHKGAIHPNILRIAAVLTIINGICVAANLFNGMFYFFDARGCYTHGSMWWLSQAIPTCITILNVFTVCYYRRAMQKKEVFSFLSYMGLSLAALLLQGIFYDPAVLYPATTVAILIIFLNIQSGQELLFQQQEQELERSRTAIMLSQIQPHFLYNALTGIKSLCKSNPQKAEKAMEHFSYFLRSNLDSLSDIKLISFSKEIGHVKDYFYLEKMRFQDRVNLILEIYYKEYMLPPLILQPLVENAIRHGITKKDDGGTVKLVSEKNENMIIITISDDGVGFDVNSPREDGHTHTGIENVKKRVQIQCGGSLTIHSEKGVGTTVKIYLPGKEGVK